MSRAAEHGGGYFRLYRLAPPDLRLEFSTFNRELPPAPNQAPHAATFRVQAPQVIPVDVPRRLPLQKSSGKHSLVTRYEHRCIACDTCPLGLTAKRQPCRSQAQSTLPSAVCGGGQELRCGRLRSGGNGDPVSHAQPSRTCSITDFQGCALRDEPERTLARVVCSFGRLLLSALQSAPLHTPPGCSAR